MSASMLKTTLQTPEPPRWGITRWHAVVVLGLLLGCWMSYHMATRVLPRTARWSEMRQASPRTARAVRAAVIFPWPIALGLLSGALLNFAVVQGAVRLRPEDTAGLPTFPFNPHKTQLIIGELHNQDGTRSEKPSWLILPEKGMYTGIIATGATGSAKTSAAQYPFTAQLIRLHTKEPEKKFAGLVLDAKGNYADFVREQCLLAGRIQDYYEVSLTSGVRYNPLARPDLSAPALAGHVADMICNVQGKSSHSDPFWQQEAKDLATQVIRIVRLAQKREPTFLDLYQLATSQDLFQAWLGLAEQRVKKGEADPAEYKALKFWIEDKLGKLDPKLRASIAAGLNGVCSLFDVGEIKAAFCPAPGEANFLGFEELIARGQIVCLRVPYAELKTVSQIVGTMTKLNFYDAVLSRLSKCEAGDVGRPTFFVADEFDAYITQPGDGNYLSKCREAKSCSIIATQSYESIVAKLGNEHSAGQLLANLRTKLWLCAEDPYTAEQAARLCGEVEKVKVSRSRNESVRHSAFSFLDRKILATDPGSVGESVQESLHREQLFPPRSFTQLRLNQAVVKLFDGVKVLEPTVAYLKPIYEDPNTSWFDTPAAAEQA